MIMAEDVLDGIFCQQCGEFLGDATGYPRSCEECEPTEDNSEEVIC